MRAFRLCWWLPVLVLLYCISFPAQSRAQAAPQVTARPLVLLALGDSLTAGYGLPQGAGFAERLEARLRAAGRDVRVINAGVSGDTSAGGLARLDWLLSDPSGTPDAAVVELGANDALRGLDPARTKANLAAILDKLRAKGVRVLLAGMLAPPNMGPAYEKDFNGLYPALAREKGVELYPFFLDGVAGDRSLNQSDGIHPTEAGVERIVDHILPRVERLLDGAARRG
ncbi:MAG TPA: arylesterase [Desulfovibrio sp.]|jgi:acyl-CoA thioesterase-1|uniref:arylesterase n=1 Tax=Desulfovibrio TaxID=872 RepID=UPI002BA3EC3C|nr:arylesterase [Desulfovibrio sp.]HMM39210.1 arylesterase [Desulfovibrio sp.]